MKIVFSLNDNSSFTSNNKIQNKTVLFFLLELYDKLYYLLFFSMKRELIKIYGKH